MCISHVQLKYHSSRISLQTRNRRTFHAPRHLLPLLLIGVLLKTARKDQFKHRAYSAYDYTLYVRETERHSRWNDGVAVINIMLHSFFSNYRLLCTELTAHRSFKWQIHNDVSNSLYGCNIYLMENKSGTLWSTLLHISSCFCKLKTTKWTVYK